MKYLVTSVLIVLCISTILAQDVQPFEEKGTVSYLSSISVYVKFESTDKMAIGDTLLIMKNGALTPCLVISNLSSMSAVCTTIGTCEPVLEDTIVFRGQSRVEEPVVDDTEPETDIARSREPVAVPDVTEEDEPEESRFRENIRGRISAASYSNMSDHGNTHRMRYAFSYRARHLRNSRFSTDNYIAFRHTLNEWDAVRNNLGHALKIYSLSASYHFNPATHVAIGRKINHKMSSIGAIDGVQFETGFGNFLAGAIAGSRPDMQDYGVNPDLLQGGVYVGHVSGIGQKYQQSTLGIVEQQNGGMTDRRFVYFQHSNRLIDRINVFTSFEFDLYENVHDEIKNTISLTNIFFSLRYRVSRKFTVYSSYDSRKNIIYYESYKSFIEQLIDDETRQGLRFGMTVRPMKFVNIGANASWRFQKGNKNDSKNVNAYLNFSKVPLINASASITANYLQTNYIESQIVGVRFSRELFTEKINADLYFKMVHYRYTNTELEVNQLTAGANLSYRLTRKLGIYVYYETTMDEGPNDLSRLNTKIIQRF